MNHQKMLRYNQIKKKIIQDVVQPYYIESSTPILQTELAENLPYLNYERRVIIDLDPFTENQKRKSKRMRIIIQLLFQMLPIS
jgi:hypothetical protein